MNPLNLFKGKIDAGKLVESVTKGIDKLAFTKEERSDFNMKTADKMAEFIGNTLSENTVRSKTRRHIALLVIYLFIILVLSAIVLSFFDKEASEFIFTVIKDSSIQTGFIMVLAFFFGGYYMKGISLNKKKD